MLGAAAIRVKVGVEMFIPDRPKILLGCVVQFRGFVNARMVTFPFLKSEVTCFVLYLKRNN